MTNFEIAPTDPSLGSSDVPPIMGLAGDVLTMNTSVIRAASRCHTATGRKMDDSMMDDK